jgi:hypothetical protein
MSDYTEGHYHIWHPEGRAYMVKCSYGEPRERPWLLNNLRYSTNELLEAGFIIGPKVEPWAPSLSEDARTPVTIRLRPMSEAPRDGRPLLLKVRDDYRAAKMNILNEYQKNINWAGRFIQGQYYINDHGNNYWATCTPDGYILDNSLLSGWAELEIIDPKGDA